MRLELTTFRLEVERAIQLRHMGKIRTPPLVLYLISDKEKILRARIELATFALLFVQLWEINPL